jgi:hypothetical protein
VFLFDKDPPFFHFEFAGQVNFVVIRLLFGGECLRNLAVTVESKPGEAASSGTADAESQAEP